MKIIAVAISFLFLHNATGQDNKDCKPVHNGVFKSVLVLDGQEHVTIITRKGAKQTEENEAMGLKMEFDVKWVSGCTYELSNPKVIKGSLPSTSPGHVLVVKILDVKKDGYQAEVSSNFFDGVSVFDFLVVK